MSAEVNTAAIHVEALSKRVGGRLILDAVTFVVPAGTAVAVVAPNGAGKSLLLDIVAGFVAPSGGRVRLFGHDPRASALRGQVATLPQRALADTVDQVGSFLRHIAGLEGLDATRVVPPVLERLALADLATMRICDLSEGVRRRVALAVVLLGRPRIVLLDEPTLGLDPAGQQAVRTAVAELKTRATVLVASSDPASVESLCAEVVGLGARQDEARRLVGAFVELPRITAPQQGACS